jgi:pimeloyl-ACP methyl ester carboxylesterase
MDERADDVVFLGGEAWQHVIELLPGVRIHCHPAVEPERLASWLEDRGVERAVVVGHGDGCSAAQALAAERPDLVAGLVLTGSGRRRSLIERLRGDGGPTVDERAADIDVPVDIVWGDRDDLGLGRRLADALGAEYDLVEDGGRYLPQEHPGRVAQAIGRVTATQRASAAAERPARPRARSSSSSAPRTHRARRPG